jgi:hypothetical protein
MESGCNAQPNAGPPVNGQKRSDMKGKLMKLVLICVICIGMITALALFIQALTQ